MFKNTNHEVSLSQLITQGIKDYIFLVGHKLIGHKLKVRSKNLEQQMFVQAAPPNTRDEVLERVD